MQEGKHRMKEEKRCMRQLTCSGSACPIASWPAELTRKGCAASPASGPPDSWNTAATMLTHFLPVTSFKMTHSTALFRAVRNTCRRDCAQQRSETYTLLDGLNRMDNRCLVFQRAEPQAQGVMRLDHVRQSLLLVLRKSKCILGPIFATLRFNVNVASPLYNLQWMIFCFSRMHAGSTSSAALRKTGKMQSSKQHDTWKDLHTIVREWEAATSSLFP